MGLIQNPILTSVPQGNTGFAPLMLLCMDVLLKIVITMAMILYLNVNVF